MAAEEENNKKNTGKGFAGLSSLVFDVDTTPSQTSSTQLPTAPDDPFGAAFYAQRQQAARTGGSQCKKTVNVEAQPASCASAAPVPTAASSRPTAVPPVQSARNTPSPRARTQRTLKTTALHQTPFAILAVTTRDGRRRIVELAEEKSLELDHDVCQKARSDLTNPRTRLSAEMAWLPGVSPRKVSQLVEGLLHDPMAVREESGLPTLAHLNLLAAAFEAVDSEHDAEDLASFIQEIAYLPTLAHLNLLAAAFEAVDSEHDAEDLASFIQEVAYLVDEIDPEDVLRDINEDRVVSGFPEVRALDQIEAELAERKRYYRSAIKDALDRLPSTTLVQVMTDTVEVVTLGGENHAPELIDDLVDSYEVETQGFLQKEAENVHKLIKAARDSANSGEAAVKPYVDKLDAVARNWDKVAQPIQLSAKARGIDHEASRDLAYEIRSLAIDLFNTHDMLTQSQRLIGLLQELFAELPEVSERVDQDADVLADIFYEQKQAVARRDECAEIDEGLTKPVIATARRAVGEAFRDALSSGGEGPAMVVLPTGRFRMGSPAGETGRFDDEGPVHTVTISRPIAMGQYPVTFEDYDLYVSMGTKRPADRGWGRGRMPVISVSWEDAKAYAAWLSEQTGKRYRLPSESEWEYAARAGTETAYSWGDEIGVNRTNCKGSGSKWSGRQTSPVGSFAPNGFGLYDMHGNVWEWVEDGWHDNYEGAPSDGSAWTSGGDSSRAVVRGGSWSYNPRLLRAAYRGRDRPSNRFSKVGFRLVQDLNP